LRTARNRRRRRDLATSRLVIRAHRRYTFASSMRSVLVLLACSLGSTVAAGANGHDDNAAGPAPVIGGGNAAAGKWPDVAAVLFPVRTGDQADCTGTLIAPTVVLTAGHCYTAIDPPLPDNVLIGTSSLARPSEGETIGVLRGIAFPDADTSIDVAVLVLARASIRTPRALATGWARVDIANGAAVSLVGFGATNKDGDDFVAELQEASTTITDFACQTSSGCRPAAQPAGELGAGGMGIDTCPGDSGGPLYLVTGYGAFLAGVTSRSYDDATFTCSEGGIYERPDKVVDWIEAVAGVPVARGPEPFAAPIVAVRGDGGETQIDVNDPRSNGHQFAITTPPAHGTAKVRGDGAVRVCTDPAAAPGNDALVVTITDTQHAGRALPIAIQIQIQDGAAAASCDFAGFDDDGGGCCDTRGAGRSGAAIPLAIGLVALVRRRGRQPRSRKRQRLG
jgi:endonuclease G